MGKIVKYRKLTSLRKKRQFPLKKQCRNGENQHISGMRLPLPLSKKRKRKGKKNNTLQKGKTTKDNMYKIHFSRIQNHLNFGQERRRQCKRANEARMR